MKLVSACNEILYQLVSLVEDMSDADFIKPSKALSNATIGQHLRHTLEFFICFRDGSSAGSINYDRRNHDKLIETDRKAATQTLYDIIAFVSSLTENRPLRLEVSYELDKDDFVSLDSNTDRELVYNIEHAVHHMAIMKIGIREVAPYVPLSPTFGIAASTIRHKQTAESLRS